ncbi:MAG: 4Fe-4S binding protein [Clostridia bacterium]|nr:4Fe-4S binding protein [Clostridia bacterium]
MSKKASVDKKTCVACGVCQKVCPKQAIEIVNGCYARVSVEKCIGCGICAKNCPAGCIKVCEV